MLMFPCRIFLDAVYNKINDGTHEREQKHY